VAAGVRDARRYVRPEGPLCTMFHFDHVMLDFDFEEGWWSVRDWDLVELKQVFTRWQTELEGWNSLYLGNHDVPRMVSRFGNDGEHRAASAKLLATFLLTLPGTPFLYQGDEIGMTNYPFSSLEEIRDPDTLGRVRQAQKRGEIDSFREVRDIVRYRSRDNARTPMQWDASPGGGFTRGEPWLAMNPNHERINVERARATPASVLDHYRRLIELRRDHPVLVYGEYELRLADHPRLYVYTVSSPPERILVVLNWSDRPTTLVPPDDLAVGHQELLIANHPSPSPRLEEKDLAPWEAHMYRRKTR